MYFHDLRSNNVLFPKHTANTQHMQVARLIQAVVNSAPMNADVHVQINAGTSGTSASNLSGPQQNTATTNTSSETCNHGSGGDGPRVTSITLPTTSTQTRSTARPQMHLTGGNIPRNLRPIPANMLSSFDRFLPCNSHHIRELPSAAGQARAQGQTLAQPAQPAQSAQPQNRSRSANRSRFSFIERMMEQQTANRATSTTQTETTAPTPSAPVSVDDTPIPLFGTQLTLRDFMNISTNAAPLNAIQQNLLQYMQTTLGASVGNQPNFDMVSKESFAMVHFIHKLILSANKYPNYQSTIEYAAPVRPVRLQHARFGRKFDT
jgi:large proline-rich protein BAG6